MTVRLYKSTDASAPTLNGTVGSLVSLLDAVLVNGYGSQPAAGWTKPYTSTNRAVFRMGTTGNTGFYLNVDDNGTGAGGAREALLTGFQTMSAFGTGTGQFPTSAQINLGTTPAGALVWRKSATADSTARPWYIIADDSCFYIFIENGEATNPVAVYSGFFGDIFSLAGTSDAYRCLLIGRNAVNTNSGIYEAFSMMVTLPNAIQTGHYMASTAQGVGASTLTGKTSDGTLTGYDKAGNTNLPPTTGAGGSGSRVFGFATVYATSLQFPNPTDGGLLLAPIRLNHQLGGIRGYMPGLWLPAQYNPAQHGDVIAGTGPMAGKTFIAMACAQANDSSTPVNQGLVLVETSDTWS